METENKLNKWKVIAMILTTIVFIILIIFASIIAGNYFKKEKINDIQNATIQGYNYCLYQNNQYILDSLQRYGFVTYQVISNNQTYAVQLILNQSRKLT